VGDKFYHASGEAFQIGINAAVNAKLVFVDFPQSEELVNCTPVYDRPSLTPVARKKLTSTESELLFNLADPGLHRF
jgi:hypothetical protein